MRGMLAHGLPPPIDGPFLSGIVRCMSYPFQVQRRV